MEVASITAQITPAHEGQDHKVYLGTSHIHWLFLDKATVSPTFLFF